MLRVKVQFWVALGLWVLGVLGSGCGVTTPEGVCRYNGKEYAQGSSFAASDGCNTCTCQQGAISCTEKACLPKTCAYIGKTYKEGESFPASDGCNSCMCSNGVPMCTLMVCAKDCLFQGKTYKEGSTFPAADGCNTCVCSGGGVSCTKKNCTEKSCGGHVAPGVDNTCPSEQYCHYTLDKMCGAADHPGVCKVKPSGCPEYYAPVCGCDGKTYENECAANAAGTSAAKIGACATPQQCEFNGKIYKDGESFCDKGSKCSCFKGKVACTDEACAESFCGGEAGLRCADGKYCKIEKGCGFDDGTGVCVDKPKSCNLIHQPVCGCDGKTYSNACDAAMAGLSVQYEGECKSQPGVCVYNGQRYKEGESFPAGDGCNTCTCRGGSALCSKMPCTGKSCGGLVPPGVDNSCPDDQYCQYSLTAMCGAADHPGVCMPKPTGCRGEYKPVCGCDGKTYSNDCEAARLGVSVQSLGACKQP
ncbi:hypothetical protein L6R29_06415 [Myxococcota bacterium]|nr:hypothetical protein [Myxococcota bacterium]